MKGAIRIGSGQNFETHFCVDKILGTATRRGRWFESNWGSHKTS